MTEKFRLSAFSEESPLAYTPVEEHRLNRDAQLYLPEPCIPFPWKDLKEETIPFLRENVLEDKRFSDENIESGPFVSVPSSSLKTDINVRKKAQTNSVNSEYACERHLTKRDVDKMGSKSYRNKCCNDVSNPCDRRIGTPIELSDQNNSFDDQMHEKLTESPVTARIPSPSSASSITSGKRLEWDSGADVGYIFSHDDYTNTNENLSTIERIALMRGCSAALFKRLDPEGTSGPPKPVTKVQSSSITFNSPIANSTPVSRVENILNNKFKETKPEVEQAETVLPGGCLYLHCDREVENDVAPGKRIGEDKCDSDKELSHKTENLHKKHSSSLVNLRSDFEKNIVQSSLPRSQSFLNLAKSKPIVSDNEFHELQPQTLTATCSVSSSSVATIVQKSTAPKTCDKIIQTLPLKLSVGVQVNESSDLLPLSGSSKVESVSRILNLGKKLDERTISISAFKNSSTNEKRKETISNACDIFKCTGAHKKGSSDIICATHKIDNFSHPSSNVEHNVMTQLLLQINKENGNSENSSSPKTLLMCDQEIGTPGSATSSSQTGESYELHQSRNEFKPESLQNSIAIVDSANSFEYLPGEIFEQSLMREQSTSSHKSSQENLSTTITSKDNKFHDTRSDSGSISVAKGVEEGVELLQKLISGKAYNGKMKKKLIQEIVNKLVGSDRKNDKHSKVSAQSSKSSVVPHDSPNAVITNVLKQHLGSGDWSECSPSNKSLGRSSLQSFEDSKTATPASGSVSVPGDNEQSKGESSEISSAAFSNNSRRNWKTPTSRSEKIFESQFLGEESGTSSNFTPPLLKLCRTEHVKQLEWIKFEINHLTQLKQLLEKQEGITKSLSKLASQEHKSCQIRRGHSKIGNAGPERNSKNLCYNSEKHNTTSETSMGGSYNESLMSSHRSNASDAYTSRTSAEGRDLRDTRHKHRSSPHSVTQGSYVLSSSGIKSDLKSPVKERTSKKKGQLNVFVQASPKSKDTSSQTCVPPNVLQEITESSQESCETAMKCCCECKRALEAIALRQKQNPSTIHKHVHKFCKCHVMSVNPNRESDVNCPENTSNAYEFNEVEKEKIFQSENVGTEDLSAHKSSNEELIRHRKESINSFFHADNDQRKNQIGQKVKCPCCGCSETGPTLSQEFATDIQKSKYERHKSSENRNKCCDAMVQANVKEPLAYLLTFEPTSSENRETRNSLPEIKLLVPTSENIKENNQTKTLDMIGSGDSCKENQCPVNGSINAKSNRELVPDTKVKKKSKLTLQEYLKTNRPDYIQHADKRSQCLADLALLRDMRKQKRLELMKLTHQPESTETKDTTSDERVILTGGPAPGKRLFTSRAMRDQARKKYQRTKEVQNKLAERKKKEDFRTNRLMAELFTKNLQKKTLKGVVNHSCTASISSC